MNVKANIWKGHRWLGEYSPRYVTVELGVKSKRYVTVMLQDSGTVNCPFLWIFDPS